ncbi:hypothetical protein Tco_1288341, partial [Tanacetum coccineum]
FENVSKLSNDSLLARGNTLQSDEDRLKLDELMALCTILQNWVLDLEKTKTTQHNEIASLKRRVKKLKNKNRINAIDADEEITLVSVYDVNVFAVSVAGDIVSTASAATTVSAATTTTATIKILGESTTTISSQLSSQQSQDKGKGILREPVKPLKKKDLIRLDEEAALKLQAEFDEEERLARERANGLSSS